MNKIDVRDFFDKLAPSWDLENVRNDTVINIILDYGGITNGKHVLDVACGTGVLFRDYLGREAGSVTGIDISPEMVKIARKKFCGTGIKVICADAAEFDFKEKFDCIMIYDAFPHFTDPVGLFSHLSKYIVTGGRITVAHSMSREKIDAYHSGGAGNVSTGLLHEDELAGIMNQWFLTDIKISDSEKYIVSGLAK